MKTKTEHYRQGDVLLIRTRKTEITKPRTAINGRLILAHGEATGHHHSVDADTCVLGDTETGVTLLEVQEAMAMLTHQEHAPVPLKKGSYRVVRQREYSPEAIRNVAD